MMSLDNLDNLVPVAHDVPTLDSESVTTSRPRVEAGSRWPLLETGVAG
jgi:hypothetical protein